MNTDELRRAARRLGRRDFLRGVGSVGLAAPLLLPFRIPHATFEWDRDGEPNLRPEALLPPDAFLDHYREEIRTRQIRIGCSFSPEQLGVYPGRERRRERSMEVLQRAVEDLGMTEIRLGLRWTSIAPDGEYLTSFYKQYLDYCFSSPDVREVTLDIGPLKTFRWPEVHVPVPVLASLDRVPSKTATITPDLEIARRSLEHASHVLEYLRLEYGGSGKPVQISFNEPYHRFGEFQWTMSDAYLDALLELVLASGAFPGCGFVVNSAQGLDLAAIGRLFDGTLRRRPELHGRLTSGFDIYPFLPPVLDVPVLREVLANIRRTRRDWDDQLAADRRRSTDPERGYRIEVTEAQAEPFGPLQAPGESLPHYQHVLAQCIDRILDPAQDRSTIRIFGVEYQVGRVVRGDATDGNRAILDLTRAINAA